MHTRISRHVLWLAAFAAIVFIGLAGAVGTAAAQGGKAHDAVAAATPYPLKGDSANSGSKTTSLSTSGANGTNGFGWEFNDSLVSDTALHASGARVGLLGDGVLHGVEGN